MIKEKEKKNRFGSPKTKIQILAEYARTVFVSLLAALIFTTLLSIHARSEMIKNLYNSSAEQQKIDEQLARQIIAQSDFIQDLSKKRYVICLRVGNLYEAAREYSKAQTAYEYAIQKSKQGVYSPYYKLARVLIAQEKFDEAQNVIKSVKDVNNKNLIKFKTRSYIEMGDKYYSIGKFLSAAKSYESAKFYYDKSSKRDKYIDRSIKERIIKSYVETADIMVKSGHNTDAAKFLKKAEKYSPNNFNIRYKLAIIYSDLDPIQSVKYFEPLLEERPQDIDSGVYSKALMKAANIAEWEGKPTQAKFYRYKIHSVDIFVNRKVVYKNDLEVYQGSFIVKKFWLKYKLEGIYRIKNVSHIDIVNLSAEFALRQGEKVLETVRIKCADKNSPIFSNGGVSKDILVTFGKNIFTRKELEQYTIDIYLYKDEKYKTLVSTMKVPLKSVYNSPEPFQ